MNMKKKKRILISLIILVFIVIAIPLSIRLIEVNKYKMTEDELEQYRQSISDYEGKNEEIGKLNSSYWDTYNEYDYNYKYAFYNQYTREHISKIYNLYMQLLDIKFPEKYSEVYAQYIYSYAVEDISCKLADSTFNGSLDEFKNYFPPSDISCYNWKLKNQFYNESYIPKDYSSPNFEQILYKIKSEYIDGDTSASKMYDELHEIFYNEDFLKQLK